ncbi:outer membrane lipoprotein carrier protein LolA [Solidesulfovibrio carbinoliphilus subsp. oakridgensis]|uniref:Outer membrane lipoprotein carrier protein LolA n=1 Tax=Solidesulfovibrio carbinoliphilus subsp. oakridgensis TaxID=694327 RepID=G7QB96_9BACT|nr:outer membrane lipoprotein carrier protein LolA [Solidesulfovibrio carbinoliphilus]EHJ48838.1 outer membrane lipoprotein carrier protein LolA [Solidesulfovibrio carbinoliphilus subsp. oakridgensis]
MKLPLTTLLAVGLAALASVALAAGSPGDTLLRLAAKAGQVRSIQTEFTQEKRLSIFKQILLSKGEFAFQRPRSLRWEYLEPVRSGFILHGDSGKRWNELAGETQDFSVRKDPIMQLVSSQILLWTTLDLKALSRTYTIAVKSDAPAVLLFTPRAAEVGPIAGLCITFTPDDAAIAVIEILEGQGDSTTIRFHGTRLNDDIDPGVFTRP